MDLIIKKKILYVSPNGFLGGAERVVLNLGQAHLSGNQFEPIILFYSNGEAVKLAKLAGIKCLVLNSPIRLSNPFKLFKALKEIRKIVVELKPDLIHNTMAYSHLTVSLAIIGLKIKTIWFQHGPVGKKLDKMASMFSVNLLFFNSQYLKELHYKSYPHVKVKNQTAIIPLGVHCHLSQNREILSQNFLTFGTAGRICEGKSFHYILEAFSLIKKENKHNQYTLLIAGSPKTEKDKVYMQELTKLREELNLKNNVNFLNHTEDMNSFYQQLDVFIHSTLTPEPFGLVIAEAMANGCLVIASNQGGAKDLIVNEETGLSYSSTGSKDAAIDELKNKINTTFSVSNRTELKKIALSGKKFIESHYSIKEMRDRVEALYLSILP